MVFVSVDSLALAPFALRRHSSMSNVVVSILDIKGIGCHRIMNGPISCKTMTMCVCGSECLCVHARVYVNTYRAAGRMTRWHTIFRVFLVPIYRSPSNSLMFPGEICKLAEFDYSVNTAMIHCQNCLWVCRAVHFCHRLNHAR